MMTNNTTKTAPRIDARPWANSFRAALRGLSDISEARAVAMRLADSSDLTAAAEAFAEARAKAAALAPRLGALAEQAQAASDAACRHDDWSQYSDWSARKSAAIEAQWSALVWGGCEDLA